MNKKQVKTKEDLELYYTKCRKIKFVEGTPLPNSIRNILERILDYEGDGERTVFIRGGHNCYANKYRSLDDVIKICKYYYPKKTIKDIINEILKYQKTFQNGFFFGWCGDIRKNNFRGFTSWEHQTFGERYGQGFIDQGFPYCKVIIKDFID